MTKKWHEVVLLGIMVLATALRILLLAQIPNGFYCDEASAGYDAYSLLLTARDQYGSFLPAFARSFGDYDEAIYRYLAVPCVWAFGLNEFAVRLPAALFGLATVAVLFALVRRLWGEPAGLASAFLLAISPWHIQFSRVAFRAVLFPFFFCLALLFFFRGIGVRAKSEGISAPRPMFLLASALAFSASLWTYSPARMFVPLMLGVLLLLYFRELWAVRRWAFVSAGLVLACLALLARFWISPEGMARGNLEMSKGIAHAGLNYLSYFSPRFLFIEGDETTLRHSPAGVGELHGFEIVTVLAGLVTVFRERGRLRWLLLAWLLLYPVPAALTSPGHALRAIIGAPLFAIFSGLGLCSLLRLARRGRAIILSVAALLAAASLAWFVRGYFIQYPRDSAVKWQYGMREALMFTLQRPGQEIIVSDQFFLPHIFILFYTQFPPAEYQKAPLLNLRQGQWHYSNVRLGRYWITSIGKLTPDEARGAMVMARTEKGERPAPELGFEELWAIQPPGGQPLITLYERP